MARSFARHAPGFGQDKTKARIAEFVAQISNETGGFTKFHENLNYSAKRIREVWPSRVTSDAQARTLERNPEALANVVYQRASMGNTQPGDGWRYRGRGALQLTFRNNYALFGQRLGIDLEGNPDLAADPAVSVQIALEFFKVGNVNAAVDRGDFTEARRITNGASLGLQEVARLRAKALAHLG
jgi:putative chitinase